MPFTLKDYSDIKELAKGGMSRIYCATQISLKRQVVIKEMAAGLVTTTSEIKRFENEAQAGASLSHDNIIRIYDFGEEKGSFYIAMEFVDGLDLDRLLRQQDFPREIGLMILQQALRGLAFAHEKGVVHRDVKAANILVGSTGAVKVVDFGLAYAGARSAQLTSTGAIVGTPVYMSPELVNGEETKDPRMDIWAAGVLLYRLITGEFPFTGENVPSTLISIIQNKEKPAEEIDKTLPASVAGQLHDCLEKDHTKRLSTLAPLIQALQDYFFELGVRDPVDMIKRYFADKDAAVGELQALCARYHWNKGNELVGNGKHVAALAHYKEALKRDPKNKEIAQAIATAEDYVAATLTTRTANVQQYVVTQVRAKRRAGKARRSVGWAVGVVAALLVAGIVFVYQPLPDALKTLPGLLSAHKLVHSASWRTIWTTVGNTGEHIVQLANHIRKTQPDVSQRIAGRGQPATVANSAVAARVAGKTNSGATVAAADNRLQNPEVPGPLQGLVRVEVNPASAEVKIDNKDVMMPKERSEGVFLAKGVHQFSAAAEGFGPATTSIAVSGSDTQIVMIGLTPLEKKPGALQIFSDIAAEFYIDGEFKGNTPTSAPIALAEGEHTVVFKRPGFAPYRKTVQIKSGETREMKVESQSGKDWE
jgi:predicted Ser/Thr protein kinase